MAVDDSDERLGYKIRRSELERVPYALVVGGKEAEAGPLGTIQMLVNEKVAADDSFRIFVTLSNDILTELGARRGPTSA